MARTIQPRQNIVRGYHASAMSSPAKMEPPKESETFEHSERILLLEDEAETNLILKEYLQSLGYRVIAVTNGVEGLKEVMKSDFELIICDMMMPHLPGDMFYLAVQKTRPQLCNRFVFITGHQESPTIDRFMAQTHAAILVKPFRLHQLEITLEGVLSRFPRKVQAASQVPTTLKIIPNALGIRSNDEIVADKQRQTFSSAPLPQDKKEPLPSIVIRALKIVGFMRDDSKTVPPPLAPAPIPTNGQTVRITRRINQEVKVTRRIPELADKPVIRPPASFTLPPLPEKPVSTTTPDRQEAPPADKTPPHHPVNGTTTRLIRKPVKSVSKEKIHLTTAVKKDAKSATPKINKSKPATVKKVAPVKVKKTSPPSKGLSKAAPAKATKSTTPPKKTAVKKGR